MSSICLPPAIPQPNQDCLDLHRAFEGLGCDGQAVIRILAHRDAYQRSQIRAVYENMYQEDICKRLKSELHRHFEKAMLMWMRDAPERDAIILRRALLKSSNTLHGNQIVAEILSTRSKDELGSINKVYDRLYGRPLVNDIEANFTGPSQKLFVLYLHGPQDETSKLEPYFILEQARKLHSALSTQIDETIFMQVLTTRNLKQLSSIFDAYRATYGLHIYEDLKQKGTTEFSKVLRIITKCISSPEDYFAKVLYKSMRGLGTDDDTLIRVVITYAEVNMTTIKVAFFRRYKKALSTTISSDTTGNYREFLLALVGAPY